LISGRSIDQRHLRTLLKKIYGLKTDEEVMGEWRKLLNEELYSSPSMIGIIGSMRMRCAGYVARMGGEEELV
jgi:hypothetical protein